MIYKANWLKEELFDNNFIGIQLNKNIVFNFLEDLRKYISNEDVFNKFTEKVTSYHITILSYMEVNEKVNEIGLLFNDKMEAVQNYEIEDIEFIGLGEQKNQYDTSYYVIVKSETINEIRKSFGLNEKDIYITIGFDVNDVHNKSKGEDTLVKIDSDLTKLIRSKIKKWKNWNFIRLIDNFPEVLNDRNLDINIIKQTQELLYVKIEHTLLQIGIFDDELRVMTISEFNS